MLCDRIAIIDHGRVIALGTLEDLRRLTRELDVVKLSFQKAAVFLIESVGVLDSVEKVVGNGNELRLHVKNADEALTDVINMVMRSEINITSIRVLKPSRCLYKAYRKGYSGRKALTL